MPAQLFPPRTNRLTDWLNALTLLLSSVPPHSSPSGRPSSIAQAAASFLSYCPAIAQRSCTYACPLPPVAPFCLFLPLRNSCLSPFRGAPPPAALMKLFIEVELSPDEIPLATELFRTLRLVLPCLALTDLAPFLQYPPSLPCVTCTRYFHFLANRGTPRACVAKFCYVCLLWVLGF